MPVIVKIQKLVVPLSYYSYCIFEESDDDQESADER